MARIATSPKCCAIKHRCTTGKERRITRWEHEHILEVVQRQLDEHPEKMRQRRETVEHPFGTIKMRMGATHFLMKTLPRVASEMALHVLAYNLTRVMNIIGIQTAHGGNQALVKAGNGSHCHFAKMRSFRKSVSTQPRPITDIITNWELPLAHTKLSLLA